MKQSLRERVARGMAKAVDPGWNWPYGFTLDAQERIRTASDRIIAMVRAEKKE